MYKRITGHTLLGLRQEHAPATHTHTHTTVLKPAHQLVLSNA